MTIQRVTQILYTAVYFVVRRNPPLPSTEEFLDTRIKDLFVDPAPSDWPAFWRETLTAALEDLFRREGCRIDGLTPEHFENRNRRMRSIRNRIAKEVMPLESPEPPARRKSATGAGRLPLAVLALVASAALAIAASADIALGAPTPAADAPATLEPTPADRPEASDYRYDIVVAFEDAGGRSVEAPLDLALDRSRYELRSSCQPEEPVTIARVVWRGVGEREGCTIGAVLYAALTPECDYTLMLRLPGVTTRRIRVARSADLNGAADDGFVRFVRFVDRRLTGTLDLRTLANEENRVGLDLRARLDIPVVRERLFADAIRCGAGIDGMFAVSKRPLHAHNALAGDFTFSALKTYALPGPARGSRYLHAIGLQLSPIGFESDQNFRRVDYTLGPAVTFSVPFLDWPLLFWHRLIELPRGFLPPTARAAFTYVHRVRAGDSPLPDRRRIDLELVAVAPILRPLDLLLRQRVYHDLESRRRTSNTELTWRWYVGPATRMAVLLKLVHGALPPLFQEADVASLGFQVGL
jgi:hypothetical protein